MTATDTIHLRALIRTAKTEQEIQPLLNEYFRSPRSNLSNADVPMFYLMGLDSLIRYEWYLSHRMILIDNEQGISLFVRE